MHGIAAHVKCRFGFVFEFFDGENKVNVGGVFAMAFYSG